MSGHLTVVADAEAAGLACPPDLVAEAGAGPVLTIGHDPPSTPGDGTWVRWSAGPPPAPDAALEIAPVGNRLWRRAPWPAADDLFDLPRAPARGPVVIAGGDEARRSELEYALGQRDLPVLVSERLTRQALESASAVLLFAAPGAEEALPVDAMAVLAARRLLVTPAAKVTFGLLPGIDHLQYTLYYEATELFLAARRYPAAFEPMRVWGALAARRHLASRAVADLEADLAVLAA